MELISGHLARLLDFTGRETRQPFWLWVLVAFGFTTVAGLIAILPMMVEAFGRMDAFARAHPDQATITEGPGHYSVQIDGYHPELMPDFGWFFAVSGIAAVLTVLLLAAAVTRRLHDRDRRGWWGLAPLPFLAGGFVLMPVLFEQTGRGEPSLALFGLLFLNNLIYLATLAGLVIMLVQRGTVGPNRFGEDLLPPPVHPR